MRANKFEVSSSSMQWLLIAAQVLSLLALLLAALFLINTTGGTLFAFATLAPLLVGVSILILIGVAIVTFRRRHRLFDVANYGPGEVVFRQGDAADSVYFIRSGEVEVVREDGGETTRLDKLSAGHYFGEMALLSNEPRNATVRATAETELAALGKHNFLTLLSVFPSTEENILKTIQQRAMEGRFISMISRAAGKGAVFLAAVTLFCSMTMQAADEKAGKAKAGDAKAGKAVYLKRCKTCHGAEGQGNPGMAKVLKVKIKHLGSEAVQGKSDDDLASVITDGMGKMKPVKRVSADDIANIVAFVRTIKE